MLSRSKAKHESEIKTCQVSILMFLLRASLKSDISIKSGLILKRRQYLSVTCCHFVPKQHAFTVTCALLAFGSDAESHAEMELK